MIRFSCFLFDFTADMIEGDVTCHTTWGSASDTYKEGWIWFFPLADLYKRLESSFLKSEMAFPFSIQEGI